VDDVRSELQEVFRSVFDDDDLLITDKTTATDIDGWDSVAHINLVIAIEKQFGVKFSASNLAAMKGTEQTVGSLVAMLVAKLDRSGGSA
jgi:acyl carrier protein